GDALARTDEGAERDGRAPSGEATEPGRADEERGLLSPPGRASTARTWRRALGVAIALPAIACSFPALDFEDAGDVGDGSPPSTGSSGGPTGGSAPGETKGSGGSNPGGSPAGPGGSMASSSSSGGAAGPGAGSGGGIGTTGGAGSPDAGRDGSSAARD